MFSGKLSEHVQDSIDSLMCNEPGYREEPPTIFQSIACSHLCGIHSRPEMCRISSQRNDPHIDLAILKAQILQHTEA
jgi:hypothetical protein